MVHLTVKKALEGTLLSMGISKLFDIISHLYFKKKDSDHELTKATLTLEAIAITIAIILVLKFGF